MDIYLSPHHDDVCFSLAHRAGRTGGMLINAFTVSRYTEAELDLAEDLRERTEVVTELRRREDTRFAAAAGLTRLDLHLPEPPVIGLDPFDHAGIDTEAARLTERLLPVLLPLLGPDPNGELPALWCPMGIGRHRNHLSLVMAIRGAFDQLEGRCALHLYEDLHYASRARSRRLGLAFAHKLFEGFELAAVVEELDEISAQRKLEWIGFYASQLAGPPALEKLTPASGLSPRPHEIVWRVRRPAKP